jgi:hypothetical protein
MEGQYVNPDAAALKELRQYSIGLDGEPFHNAEHQKEDPTGARKAHADPWWPMPWAGSRHWTSGVSPGARSGRR